MNAYQRVIYSHGNPSVSSTPITGAHIICIYMLKNVASVLVMHRQKYILPTKTRKPFHIYSPYSYECLYVCYVIFSNPASIILESLLVYASNLYVFYMVTKYINSVHLCITLSKLKFRREL